MVILLIVLFSILFVYSCLIVRWHYQWFRTPHFACGEEPCNYTLIIPLHNEVRRVRPLLLSLLKQSDFFDDVIFVCDHCTDGTEEYLGHYLIDYPQARLLNNTDKQGKKEAIKCGVAYARHDIIVTIDADCKMPRCWGQVLASYHAKNSPDLLIAPVRMRGKDSFWGHIFELDFLALQMTTAGSAIAGTPIMCNGSNLSFRREVYDNHESQSKYVSGDDMFLLSSAKTQKRNIQFIKNSDAIAETPTPTTIIDFLNQRTRWLRKSTGYTDAMTIFVAWLVFFTNLIWPTFLVLWITSYMSILPFVASFVAKFLIDYALLLSGRHFWNIRVGFLHVLTLAIIYPFSMLTITFLTLFRSRTTWK